MSFILGACFLWALDALIRYPLLEQGYSAIEIVLLEHAFVLACLLPAMGKFIKGLWTRPVGEIFDFFMVGGLGSAIATLSFTRAFALLNPSVVILLQKFQPVLVILLAALILKEKIQKQFILWAALCLAGAFLVSAHEIDGLLNGNVAWSSLVKLEDTQGLIFAGISVLGWALATVYGKVLVSKGHTPVSVMCGRFLMGFITLLLFIPQDFSFNHPGNYYGKVILMAFLSGLAAMYLYYKGMERVPAKYATLAELFFPLLAVLLNWVILDQPLTAMQLVGGFLLMIGSTAIQLKKL